MSYIQDFAIRNYPHCGCGFGYEISVNFADGAAAYLHCFIGSPRTHLPFPTPHPPSNQNHCQDTISMCLGTPWHSLTSLSQPRPGKSTMGYCPYMLSPEGMLENDTLIQVVLVLLTFYLADTTIVCIHLWHVDKVVYMVILDGIDVRELKLFCKWNYTHTLRKSLLNILGMFLGLGLRMVISVFGSLD